MLGDLLRILFSAVIVLSVAAAVMLLPAVKPQWRDLLGRAAVALFCHLLAVAVLRQIVPRPLEGLHRVAATAAYLRWILSSILSEVALRGLVRAPFWLLHSTRCLYLRALGADLAWRITIPADVVIREPALVAVGSGSQLEGGVKLEPAVHGVGRVQIGKIAIGEGCLIGAQSLIMAGASIAHEARIGPGAYIGPDARIGFHASIGARAVIGDGVEIGSYAVIGPGAVLSDGVRVAERGRVSAGAVVPPNTVIGEREVFVPERTSSEAAQPGA